MDTTSRPGRTPSTTESGIVTLTKALLTLDSAARHCTAQGRHYAGVHAADAFRDLLHAVRVTLTNPDSRQAHELAEAITRFDTIRDGSGE
jgi:hypothetical protein